MRVTVSSIMVVVAACTAPSPEPSSPERDRDHEAPSSSLTAAEQDEAQTWIARYQRGETSMSTDDPRVEFVATGRGTCEAMPPTRPPGFELVYWQDPYEDMVETYYGIAGRDRGVCQFEWDMLWVDPPGGACAVLDDAHFDALYAELRALEPWTIETQSMDPTPHSVGFGLLIRWPGSRCEILDVHGVAEVVERDSPAFQSALEAFRRAYDASLAPPNAN